MRFTTLVDDNGRVCTRCKKYKTRDNYRVNNHGHQSACKSCMALFYKSRAGDVIDYVNGDITKRNKVVLKANNITYQPKHEPPNIDEVLGFEMIHHEEEDEYV